MKFKKWIIIISTLVAFIALIITLSFTAFSLKAVEIDFRTSTSFITSELTKEDIISAGKFKKGKPVFSHNKSQYKKNIDNLNPYIKVINIETVFPSKFVVHIAERQEIYAVKGLEEKYYICDEQMRILRIEEDYQNNSSSPMLLSQFEKPVLKDYDEGDYLTEIRQPNIYGYLYENNRKLGEQKSLIESITLTSEYDNLLKKEQTVTSLKFYSGQTFNIVNDSYAMKYKVKLMLDVFSQLYDLDGKQVIIGKDENGQNIYSKPLDMEYLNTCTIIITNYYNYRDEFVDIGAKDCYFKFVLDENYL